LAFEARRTLAFIGFSAHPPWLLLAFAQRRDPRRPRRSLQDFNKFQHRPAIPAAAAPSSPTTEAAHLRRLVIECRSPAAYENLPAPAKEPVQPKTDVDIIHVLFFLQVCPLSPLSQVEASAPLVNPSCVA